MIVSTAEHLVTVLTLLTRVDLIVERMVDLLFPAMTEGAKSLQRTALVIRADKVARLPVRAKDA